MEVSDDVVEAFTEVLGHLISDNDALSTSPYRNWRGDLKLMAIAGDATAKPKELQGDNSNWRKEEFRTVKHKDAPRQLGFK